MMYEFLEGIEHRMSWIDGHMSESIGVDLGTDHIRVYLAGQGIVLNEATAIAVLKDTDEVVAAGNEAEALRGRTPQAIRLIHPMENGMICDDEHTRMFLKQILSKIKTKNLLKPIMMITVPCGATAVQERAVIEVAQSVGARKVYLVEEPVAAALGAGCDITLARGLMVLDIGGGISDLSVVSLSNSVVHASSMVAGDDFTDAVIAYLYKRYRLEIGYATARELKEKIGGVLPRETTLSMTVSGADATTKLPRKVTVYSNELTEAFEEVTERIVSLVKSALDETPTEILADVLEDGILLTGGGAKLYGLDQRLRAETGIKIFLAEDAEFCAVKGTGIAIEHLEELPGIVHNFHNM